VKLGILGGTFDPIHLGHLRAAETAREALGLERVALVPSRIPPHRRVPLSAAWDRFAMVALAASGHPAFFASDLELRREGPSYTVDTLRALREERPTDELVLIVGSDTFPEISGWREPAAIAALCRLAVVTRPGETSSAGDGGGPPGARVSPVQGPTLPVSSTEVRRRVAEGSSIRFLVSDGVADYIAKKGLYR
jgi:nicotinate-nucleotide adenylyltransferase